MNPKVRKRITFFSAFLIAAVVFGAMIALAVLLRPQDIEQQEAEAAFAPGKSDAITLLVIGTNTQKTAVRTATLVKFDPEHKKVPVLGLDLRLRATAGGKTDTLAGLYRYGGAKLLMQAVSSLTGLPTDRYVKADAAAMEKMVNLTGGAVLILPGEVKTESFLLKAGRQLLTGAQASAFLRQEEDPQYAAALVCSMVDRQLTEQTVGALEDVFHHVIDYVETDFSYADYFNRRRALAYLAKVDQPAQAVKLTCTEKDGVLETDAQSLAQVRVAFGAQ
jgi:anionic cell wall polymer biosynthesis LytR-Cps2A-Psr (LCP) family protein